MLIAIKKNPHKTISNGAGPGLVHTGLAPEKKNVILVHIPKRCVLGSYFLEASPCGLVRIF